MTKRILISLVVVFLTACANSNGHEKPELSAEAKVQQGLSDGLDLLVDYDRASWKGPYAWTDEQWVWKRRLKWDQSCDYSATIETYSLKSGSQLVRVICAPGAYQPIQYLFTYQQETGQGNIVHLFPNREEPNSYEVTGLFEFNQENKVMTIFSKSRGIGDCGNYKVYDFKQLNNNRPKLIEWRQHECSDDLRTGEYLPPSEWPQKDIQ